MRCRSDLAQRDGLLLGCGSGSASGAGIKIKRSGICAWQRQRALGKVLDFGETAVERGFRAGCCIFCVAFHVAIEPGILRRKLLPIEDEARDYLSCIAAHICTSK